MPCLVRLQTAPLPGQGHEQPRRTTPGRLLRQRQQKPRTGHPGRLTMHLVPINLETLQLGQPLPFTLRNAGGEILAPKGFVIGTREHLDDLLARGLQLCADIRESNDYQRAYLDQLQHMVAAGSSLGDIAAAQLKARPASAPALGRRSLPQDWPALQLHATQLLRTPQASDFCLRLEELREHLQQHCRQAPDATLFALMFLSMQETQFYSATHGLLVACIATMTAHCTLRWPEEQVRRTALVSLAMNVSMTGLQDLLAVQQQPLDAAQLEAVQTHAGRSAQLLQHLGITDSVVLEAVRFHHHRLPGPLEDKSPAQQLARLVHRTDIFAARMAPRSTRVPMPVPAAMQACYYNEEFQVDEAGAALIKTLGIHPPGSFVRLASQEVALVCKRGTTATTPRVAVLINREGLPTGEPIWRDTALAAWKIVANLPLGEVRVTVPLSRLLAFMGST